MSRPFDRSVNAAILVSVLALLAWAMATAWGAGLVSGQPE
jgi:hypothetical protein